MFSRRRVALWIGALAVIVFQAGVAFGQAADEDKPAPPMNLALKTDDGVTIAATYLPSKKGKDAVIVILLHMYQGNRRDMEGLGLYLQKLGHAVMMPDLRGHGDSTSQVINGREIKLEAAKLPVLEFGKMVEDVETVKRFLVKENNLGKLNIEKLCLIGAEMGASVAAYYTAGDWAAQDLGAQKQSKAVKAVVMLSPQANFKSLLMAKPLNFEPVRDKVAFFLIAGAEDTVGVENVRRMAQQLERNRGTPATIEQKTVFTEVELKTKLIGSKLLGEPTINVEQLIEQFIGLRVVTDTTPWLARPWAREE